MPTNADNVEQDSTNQDKPGKITQKLHIIIQLERWNWEINQLREFECFHIQRERERDEGCVGEGDFKQLLSTQTDAQHDE